VFAGSLELLVLICALMGDGNGVNDYF
jgi:hypothetical protein